MIGPKRQVIVLKEPNILIHASVKALKNSGSWLINMSGPIPQS